MEEILQVVENIEREEFGVFLLRLLKSARTKEFIGDLTKSKAWESLYKKYNKYADYNELRIYINDGSLELNGHEIEN